MRREKYRKRALILGLILIILFLSDILVGSIRIPLGELLPWFGNDLSSIYSNILIQFRIPKAITCVLAGGALATGGLLMQTLFRNPLAGPDVLGLSSGASLVVAILVFVSHVKSEWGLLYFNNPWSMALGASLGGGVVFLLIIAIAHYIRDNTSLLIIGLMISALTSSLVSVLQYLGKAEDLQTFMIWTLGNVGSTSWNELIVLSLVVLMGVTIAFITSKSLNTWLLGENYAQGLGVNIRQSRLLIVVSTGLLTGGVTAFCGPIAFVGLAVPHLVRLIIPTTNHRILIPAVICGGACLLLLCDLLSQLPGSTQILPLNAITSLIGAPVVIWMIIKSRRIHV
jgi:iron complex transport system permease protein